MHTAIFKLLLFVFGYTVLDASQDVRSTNEPYVADPKVVLENLRAFYSKHGYIYHELSYTLYASHSSDSPYSVDKGIFIQQDGVRYSQLASIESLTNGEYTIGVDNDERLMMIANNIYLPPNATPVDQLEAWTANPDYVEVKYGSEQYDFLLIKTEIGEVEKVEIWFDKLTFQPAKMIFNYRRSIVLETDADGDPVQPRMEIEYLQTGFEGQGQERLNLEAFVVHTPNGWQPAPAYKGYELIENIHTVPIQN